MPDENSKTEATLADLAVNLVLGRTPALAGHYLGFDLIPGSVNETKTRAAGLLGFKIGQETVCVPVLFLNGKVKGTEILYMQDPDVFTSNSRQWIEYLLSKDSSTMGTGMTPSQPLRQGGGTGMRTFSMNPGSISKSAEFFDNTARDFWSKIAEAPPEAADLHANPNFTLKGVLTKLGKPAYVEFMNMLDQNPALLAKVAHHFDLDTELFITEWSEEKVAAAAEVDPFETSAGVVCVRSSELLDERLSKTATLSALDLPSKERCMRDGLLFIDKRAEKEKSLVAREEYRHRFSAPSRNGFYEVLNRGGELEKVFVAQSPLIIESPAQSLPGFIVLDPESGVIVAPPMGQQVFVRSEFVTDEAVWKEKFKGMTAVSAAEVNKSYILISPSMRASAPFRVNGKVKEGDEMHLICDTPWEYKYRSSSISDTCCAVPCGFSSGSHAGGMVKVIECEDESRVARVGNITFVPSSWRLQEVYGDSSSLEYANDYVPPQESPSEKKKREERTEKRKAYFKILPGDAGTLNAITINKDQFKLTLQKEANDRYQLGFAGTILPAMSRNDAMESMVIGLNMSIEKAAELLDETLTHKETTAFLVPKVAALGGFFTTPDEIQHTQAGANAGTAIGAAGGGVAGMMLPALGGKWLGGQIGSLSSGDPETQARRKRIGSLIGLLGGVAAGVPGALVGMEIGAHAGSNIGASVGRKMASDPGEPGPFPWPKGTPGTSNNAIVAWSDRGSGHKAKIETEASLSKPGLPVVDLPDKRTVSATSGKTAAGPLAQWAAQKLARHGLNEDGAIYGGMAVPDLSTDLGPNVSGVPEQTGAFANEVIPMNSMKDPADNWRDPDFANWDKMQQKDLDFLMRASDTGSKPVFESSMINLLLKTNRVSNQIEEWLPDLVNSLDSKCRLLLLFYWHSKDFSNDYGKDEMAEFEDVLLNAIKCDGQLVLFLKQSAGQSAHAMVNPFQ